MTRARLDAAMLDAMRARTTTTHILITHPDGRRVVFHARRFDAGTLLGELVQLHESVPWGHATDAELWAAVKDGLQ